MTAPNAPTQQFVSFTLGGERYAADIRNLQEIKGFDPVTRVPYAPSYLLGVTNLRGAIVPIIDLRLRFSLAQVPYEKTTVILIVRVRSKDGERTAGVVVDAVNEVHDIDGDAIRPPPSLPGMADDAFIQGIAHVDGRTVMLLDIERLVNTSVAAA
jgi:purine-binding chemotaxis protein CheW